MTYQRVGINGLKGILPDLSEKSSTGVHYTNHSLRATAITHVQLWNPREVTAENSGWTQEYKSVEKTSQKLQQNVTSAVNNSENQDCKLRVSVDQALQ